MYHNRDVHSLHSNRVHKITMTTYVRGQVGHAFIVMHDESALITMCARGVNGHLDTSTSGRLFLLALHNRHASVFFVCSFVNLAYGAGVVASFAKQPKRP